MLSIISIYNKTVIAVLDRAYTGYEHLQGVEVIGRLILPYSLINSSILRSAVVSPLASGAGYIAGGTASGLFNGQSLGKEKNETKYCNLYALTK